MLAGLNTRFPSNGWSRHRSKPAVFNPAASSASGESNP